jgi:hypothetical protein
MTRRRALASKGSCSVVNVFRPSLKACYTPLKNNTRQPIIGKLVSKAFYRRGLNAAEKKNTPHGAE